MELNELKLYLEKEMGREINEIEDLIMKISYNQGRIDTIKEYKNTHEQVHQVINKMREKFKELKQAR